VRFAVVIGLFLVGCGGHSAGGRPPGMDGGGAIGDPDRHPDGSVGGAGGAAEVQPCRLLGLGHTASMDLSPDGVWAAYGSIEGGVTLIGMADFVARRTITAHPARVDAVAFSPDSTQIASGDRRGNLALWRVSDGGSVWSGSPLDGPVVALAFGVAGRLWALTSSGLWAVDAATGAHAATAGAGTAAALAVSPGGEQLALGMPDGSYRLLAAADLQMQVSVPAAHPGGVTALRFSRNGQRLVTGGADGTTALWDLGGNLVARVAQPGHPVSSVDINQDGTVLSAGTKSPEGVYAFQPDGTMLGGYVVFPIGGRLSMDGQYLVSMTDIGRADRGPIDITQTAGLANWLDLFSAVAFSPDGRLVAESADDNVRLWDTTTGELVRVLDTSPRLTTPAQAIAFSPDGTALARNELGSSVYVLQTSDSALVAKYSGALETYSLAYTPDGQWLAAPGPSNVRLWHLPDGSPGPTGFVGHGGQQPTAVAFSPDGSTLAVGDAGGNATLWSFPDGAVRSTFAALPIEIHQIAITADGARVVALDVDGYPALFTTTGTRLATWPEGIPSFALSDDGDYLATVPYVTVGVQPDGSIPQVTEILLSSPRTGAPLGSYRLTIDLDGQTSLAGGVMAFAPTDHRVIVGDLLGRVICLP
jgi:WD40 repeat protein